MKSYTVRYERDEAGWWVASVVGVDGCHTQGRTIQQAEARIREALGLFVKGAKTATLERDVKLPARAGAALREALTLRDRATKVDKEATEATSRALRRLVELGLSRRDAGALVGLSHQRVQQIVDHDLPR